jgi:pimeloyl-ACP methyl ester carboxylesterase
MIKELIQEYKLIGKLKRESLKREPAPIDWNIGTKGDVVLLLGVAERWPFVKPVGDLLSGLGYRIWVYDGPNFNFESIDELSISFETVLKKNDLKNVRVVGHSKGGLVARYFIENSKELWRVKDITTIACPHHGSWAALLFYHKYKELLPSSKLFDEVSSDNDGLKIIKSYYPRFDNHVFPQSSLKLDGIECIRLDVVGHTRILYSKQLKEALERDFS